MKRLIVPISAILGIAAMLVASPVSGRSRSALVANIPFEFTVGKTVLPAGEYAVELESVSQGTLLIRSTDRRRSAMVLTDAAYARGEMNKSSLVFHRYGDRCFLRTVWTAGNDAGCELQESAAEREINREYRLARSHQEAQILTIAAYRQ